MNVQFHGASNRSNVQHISVKSSGTVVLRYSDGKEYVEPDEYSSFNVVPGR